jgi:hypothetical protein
MSLHEAAYDQDSADAVAEEPSESSDAATAVLVDATHACRDRRGMVKSVLITITSAGTVLHADRSDIAKATKRADIIKAARKKRLAVDEQALDQALIALAQQFNSTDGPAASDSATAQAARVSNTLYFRESGALYLNALEGPAQLTNFDATITADVLEDDGSGAPRRYYEITALVLGMAALTFEVPDDDFTSMAWVPRYLGPSAVVYAGSWTRITPARPFRNYPRSRFRSGASTRIWASALSMVSAYSSTQAERWGSMGLSQISASVRPLPWIATSSPRRRAAANSWPPCERRWRC